VVGVKREAEGFLGEDDVRAFKLRRKQVTTGLGEIYDPGLITVRAKKEEPPQDAPIPGPSTSTRTVQLPERPYPDLSTEGGATTKTEEEESSQLSKPNPSSKWAKAKWSEPLPDIAADDRTPKFGHKPQGRTPEPKQAQVKSEELEVKVEEESNVSRDAVPIDDDGMSGVKFKKRRAPVGAGRGRREV
jgi:WW domain-binding protein 4